MSGAVRLTDKVIGRTSGEHSGHYPPCPSCTITGEIVSGCSYNVFTNGLAASKLGAIDIERDCCCTGYGEVVTGSSKVLINGVGATRKSDIIAPHNGSVKIGSSSENVFIY